MRMWMINPKSMCKKHLLGEHYELHMIIGWLKKKKNIRKFITNNLIQPLSIVDRHEDLVKEMNSRDMKHASPLHFDELFLNYLSKEEVSYTIDIESSTKDLYARCNKNCFELSLKLGNNDY